MLYSSSIFRRREYGIHFAFRLPLDYPERDGLQSSGFFHPWKWRPVTRYPWDIPGYTLCFPGFFGKLWCKIPAVRTTWAQCFFKLCNKNMADHTWGNKFRNGKLRLWCFCVSFRPIDNEIAFKNLYWKFDCYRGRKRSRLLTRKARTASSLFIEVKRILFKLTRRAPNTCYCL